MSHFNLPPEQYAREVLHKQGIDEIPTPINKICDAFDITVCFESDLDAEGICLHV